MLMAMASADLAPAPASASTTLLELGGGGEGGIGEGGVLGLMVVVAVIAGMMTVKAGRVKRRGREGGGEGRAARVDSLYGAMLPVSVSKSQQDAGVL